MNNLFLKVIILLLAVLSTAIYAEQNSSGSIEKKQNDVISITNSDKQKITKDFYELRNWLITNILQEKNIQTIRKTTRSYDVKSIDELKSNLIRLATIQLKSGDNIPEECSYFRLSVSTSVIGNTIKKLKNCEGDICTEEKLKDIVDILKNEIKYQGTFLPQCHESGVLLEN